MTASANLNAYDDCIEIFNRAMRLPKGTWLRAPDHGSAMQLKIRLHYCRKLLRLQSMEIYSEGDPEYGISPYETLSVTVRDSVVYIRKIETLTWPTGEIADSPS